MHPIEQRLFYLDQLDQTGLMTHIVAGYPSLEQNIAIVQAMAEAGADFIEIQIPFSDPVADGPTIMDANHTALEQGTTVQDCFHLMYELSHLVEIPLLFMSYFNLVHNYGVERFCLDARKAGVSGLLVPDLPIEEDALENLTTAASENALFNIRFLSPGTSPERRKLILRDAKGFVYCFSSFGTTGARNDFNQNLGEFLSSVKQETELPLAVGFGISTPDHVAEVAQAGADIAIVGSALIDQLRDKSPGDQVTAAASFVSQLKK